MQVRAAPHVVDHDEERPVTQHALKLGPSRLGRGELRLTPEQLDPVIEATCEVAGALTHADPQDAVREGLTHVGIMAEGCGQRRLPEAARALQGGGDGDRPVSFTQKRITELTVFRRALDEVLGHARRHPGGGAGSGDVGLLQPSHLFEDLSVVLVELQVLLPEQAMVDVTHDAMRLLGSALGRKGQLPALLIQGGNKLGEQVADALRPDAFLDQAREVVTVRDMARAELALDLPP